MNKTEILARLEEIKKIKKDLEQYNTPNNSIKNSYPDDNGQLTEPKELLKDGVSIIIPTYKGEKVIRKCLDSLSKQTLSKDKFEVIIVINGEKDTTESIVKSYIEDYDMKNIYIVFSPIASASSSRNLGIQKATKKYITFLDDDDYISDNYLEEMLRFASLDSIVVAQIYNVDNLGKIDDGNFINNEIKKAEQSKVADIRSLNMVVTINACKLIPTTKIKEITFNPTLKSGEDIVFFGELFIKNDFKFKIIPIQNKAVYYRVIRENSVSRKAMTYDFYVTQRLAVIKNLNELLEGAVDENKKMFLKQKINAQSSFINRFIKENPSNRNRVIADIKELNLTYIPYPIINKGLASKLIISYCFPPYVDTSGNVMGKRLRNMNDVVDVIYNKMDKVRNKDFNLNYLVDDLIDERIVVPSYPSFSNWKAIEDFCKLGLSNIKEDKQYKEIYSRAMWPGSHFLAYMYKNSNPKVKWVAEFSDPILLDIHGNNREANIENASFLKEANKKIGKKYKLPSVDNKNLFFWCEYLPYLFADELVFTNENQLKYMIDTFPIKKVRSLIREKAKVIPQPTLTQEYYNIKKSEYNLDANKVNFAYFGTFYQTRNLDDLFLGLENVHYDLRKDINLHVFTSDPQTLLDSLRESKIINNVKVNPYESYMEFLNLTTNFDCLVVNDAITKNKKAINPYLPSKYSDYAGSGKKIWAICEKGSILSKLDVPYKTELGNVKEATEIFEQIVKDSQKVELNHIN